jgi:hypothetical protein
MSTIFTLATIFRESDQPTTGVVNVGFRVFHSRWGSQMGRDHWEDQDVDGWTILKWILERQDGMVGIGSIWLRIRTGGGLM